MVLEGKKEPFYEGVWESFVMEVTFSLEDRRVVEHREGPPA